jgi:hypothetical protein
MLRTRCILSIVTIGEIVVIGICNNYSSHSIPRHSPSGQAMTVISEPGSFTGQASSKPHQYWAFISYAHHDARIAQTLKKRLAEMRVPPALRSKVASGLPTFSDIFLDVHDAGADHSLNEELEEASPHRGI